MLIKFFGVWALNEELVYLIIFITFVIVYTVAKVISYMRKSNKQWQRVDKTKLVKWDNDRDWSDLIKFMAVFKVKKRRYKISIAPK